MAQADVLVHVHVPKCAGTSIRVWLYRAYPLGFGSWYPHYVFDDERLASVGLGDLRLRALSTHNIQRFPAVSCGRNMRYFTLLREPIAHFLSLARYSQQETIRPSALDEMPDNFAEMTTRDFAVWRFSSARKAPLRDNNPQTNFFAVHTWCDAGGGRLDPEQYNTWSEADRQAYRRDRLDIAKDVLRRFAAVGTTDLFAERLLDEALGGAQAPDLSRASSL